MSDRKKKRREYKRKWMANARLRSKHFVAVSSSEEECEITDPCSSFHVPLSSAYNSQQLHEVQVGISFSDGQINEHLLDVDGRREDSEADENSKSSDDGIDWDTVDKYAALSIYSDSSSMEEEDILADDLVNWTNQFQVNHNALDALLKILKKHGHSSLPSTARTLLKTVRVVETQSVSGMEYFNFGIESELIKNFEQYPQSERDNIDSIDISLNIDGLPLFKSNNTSLWPILCEIQLKPKKVFPFVLTIGPTKPENLNFLQESVHEIDTLLQQGFNYHGRLISVNLKCIVCDAPAKAMVKGVKLFSGYYGCDRCNQTGVWCGRITYQDIGNLQLRTDHSFRNQVQEEHHHTISPFCHLNIDMVNQFPIDYMHQACLGVVKRLLLLWMRGKGPRHIRMSAQNIEEISNRLTDLAKFVPKRFARKPRGLREIDRWKTTEFRQFFIYTGKIVLKRVLRPDFYAHFLSLSISISILVCPRLVNEHVNYARNLLQYFVSQGRILYGEEFLVYNVHSMLHISDDAEKYGCLDDCGAFGFENYLHRIKKMVRSGKKPLTQIVKRIKEFQNGSDSRESQTSDGEIHLSLRQPDNAFLIGINRCCQLLSKTNNRDEEGNLLILRRVYTRSEAYFQTPCDSRIIGVYRFDKRFTMVEYVSSKNLDKQAILIEREDDNDVVVLAILHDF